MDSHDIKLAANILEALECAKEANALLPPLPPKMKPVYVRILNAIYKIRDDNGSARVSDISKASGFLLPNTTKFINELVELKVVEKFTQASDKRVVLVQATEMGEEYIQKYVLSFHHGLEKEFLKLNEADCITMIETIQKVYQAMKNVYQDNRN
ncbi:MAG TPA: hypothetical protein VN258_17115 [Mobilitalea sp.]|nr:hypothetical protein [Mobilitalea sp.]